MEGNTDFSTDDSKEEVVDEYVIDEVAYWRNRQWDAPTKDDTVTDETVERRGS